MAGKGLLWSGLWGAKGGAAGQSPSPPGPGCAGWVPGGAQASPPWQGPSTDEALHGVPAPAGRHYLLTPLEELCPQRTAQGCHSPG